MKLLSQQTMGEFTKQIRTTS